MIIQYDGISLQAILFFMTNTKEEREKMKARIIDTAISDKRMLTIYEASQYIGLGTRTARKYLEEIGAVRKFGSRVLFDKNVIDQALDQQQND